jgi:type II secretory pathway pseudopilin PulG
VRTFSLLEAAAAVAVVGSVLAVGVPAFLRNLHASRLVEPMEGLAHIARNAAAAAAQSDQLAYPPSVGLTPSVVPAGIATKDPAGTWEQPTWLSLDFRFTVPHRYAFEFESERRNHRARYRASAHGDLDGDGQLSDFSVQGETVEGRAPFTYPLEMHREIE